jgi:hypothetical protein
MSIVHLNYVALGITAGVGVAAPALLAIAACAWKPRHADVASLQHSSRLTPRSNAFQFFHHYKRSLAVVMLVGTLIVDQALIYAVLVPRRLLTMPVIRTIGVLSEIGCFSAVVVGFMGARKERKKLLGVSALILACWGILAFYVLFLRGTGNVP